MTNTPLDSPQINETLAQLRPADVLDNGITRKVGVDEVQIPLAQPTEPTKAKNKSKEAMPSVPYYKLYRYTSTLQAAASTYLYDPPADMYG